MAFARSALRLANTVRWHLGGVMLVMAFAFAGHYMGQNAIAHNAEQGSTLEAVVAPSSNIMSKGSLLPEGNTFEIVNIAAMNKQAVAATGKGDMVEVSEPAPAKQDATVQIIPASVDLKSVEPEKKKIALAPSTKVEKAFKLKRSERQKEVAQRRVKLARGKLPRARRLFRGPL
jgi:hypothetical protein